MSENTNNNQKPRFVIPSASKVYQSTSTPSNNNLFKQKSSTSNDTSDQSKDNDINQKLKPEIESLKDNENSKDSNTQTNITPKITNVPQQPLTSTTSNISNYKSLSKSALPPLPAQPTSNKAGTSGSIFVNSCQRGNPILGNVRAVGWEYKDIVPDYVVGRTTCVLYLSLRYHKLYPDYIYQRVQQLKSSYVLRVLLCRVDIADPDKYLQELTKFGLNANLALFLAWSDEEAGSYLESFKLFENQSPESLKEKADSDPLSQFNDVLTKVRAVNKTDVLTLASNFGSFNNLLDTNIHNLSLCPGFGVVKAQRLKTALDAPFKPSKNDIN